MEDAETGRPGDAVAARAGGPGGGRHHDRPGDPPPGPVVLFDGVCNLCNRAVDFILSRDRSGVFKVGSLQSDEARPFLSRAGLPPGYQDSLVLVDGSRWYARSDAALEIARRLGGPWAVLSALRVVPRPVRDAVYDWIARNRYRWFGTRETCRVPTAEERDRFL